MFVVNLRADLQSQRNRCTTSHHVGHIDITTLQTILQWNGIFLCVLSNDCHVEN
jgi:hypothetical protein